MLADAPEGLGEAALDRLGQLRAQLLELREALLEVLALVDQLLDALLLALVLLLRERVDLTERLAAPAQALEGRLELLPVLAVGGLGTRGVESALGLAALGLDGRELDVDRSGSLARFSRCSPKLGLGRAEPAKLGRELARAGAAGIGAGTERSLQP